MKRAYVFPGQGAQFSGMGKDLYQSSDKAREMMEKANDILGFRLTDVMFEGSDEQLRATNVTQSAWPCAVPIFLSPIWWEATRWASFRPLWLAGQSASKMH